MNSLKLIKVENQSSIIKILFFYISEFEKDNSFFIECLIKFSAVRKIMVMGYFRLLKDGKIVPIENLHNDEKISFWNDAKEFAAGRLDNDQCIEFTKCLYTLKYF